MFNYVSSPNTRGTLDILWSSLFTIIACTWSLQHPNVPEQRDARDAGWLGWLGDIKWGLKSLYRSILRMFWTIIAPELIIMMACHELNWARKDHTDMQNFVSEDGITWSLSHSYYANMGGFVIRSTPTSEDKYHDPYHLNSRGIHKLLQRGHIKLPKTTTEEIKDKSKSDIFVKLIALGQIVWSIIQIIVRATKRLVVTPLEVAVVAFAVSAVIIYGLYWKKPQRVGVTQTIWKVDGAIPKDVLKELKAAQKVDKAFGSPRLPGVPMSLDADSRDGRDAIVVGAIGASLFGGIHVVAWNFAFPTKIELIFWRCASIFTTAAPVGVMVLTALSLKAHTVLEDSAKSKIYRIQILEFTKNMLAGSAFILSVLYIVARLFIIVEMFRTLCFLPPGSYVSTWTSNIPHFA